MTEERETEFVNGTVGGIIEKGDKWQIEVNVGTQYPRKLWTKSADTVALARTLYGKPTTFECGVSHYTNQQTGAPAKSLWINAINPGAPPPGTFVATTSGPPASITTPRPLSDPTRDSIEKQVALKAAVEFWSTGVTAGLPNSDGMQDVIVATAQIFFDWLQGRAAAPENPPEPNPGMGLDIDGDSIPF